ncbi:MULTISPECIES: aldehyde dehydrogenase family protein [Halobacteriovorax]|uniref:Aldehyde dehydrogenase n=1 Tax=Halobacteriovorax vibrionivorans TaxID=2152716 RepID=A0ABY0IL81_9BACT|nr:MULTISPECIES: aldehyde dehydrogenase family protein [Halobacteriovorax]RZF23239.1 aldehyde dehydrogenase family protein [Halobacteriovorax vibrionivorans]TGD46092.1 aldehyde dehydrogenase family protein [Halobacteriovorax sp. Y22]
MDNNIATIYTAQKGRKELSYNDRISVLEALEERIKDLEPRIVDALKADLRKPRFESFLSEIDFCLHEIKTVKKKLKKWMKPRRVCSPLPFMPAKSRIHFEPYGQVLVIAPWNYPFQLAIVPLIGAIAAGNKVILKPSEVAPNTSSILNELISSALDSEIAAVVEGGVDETTELLNLKFDYIFYTGNGHVGRIIMAAAAKNLTPLTLELGGKSPAIVGTKNLDLAAKRIVWGKFFNAGQTCVAPDYVLLRKEDQDEFINSAKKYLVQFYGDNVKNSPDYGRIINERHFDRLNALVKKDDVLIGGDVDKSDLYISPTFIKANESSEIMQDEIFGPILPLVNIDNLDEAIAYVKRHDKPLACYAFLDKTSEKNRVINEISSGGMVINDTIIHLSNDQLPFGGVGESGMGAYHGKHSFELFSHRKSVMNRAFFLENDLRYPPYSKKESFIRKLMNLIS